MVTAVTEPGAVAVWSAEQVLALAPDASSQKSARGLATPRPWQESGFCAEPPSLWGLCAGSGKTPYQTCVDLTEPAYRCSCPSRKFPCKHALALLLLWSAGSVPTAAEPPDWVKEWQDSRSERKAKASARAEAVAEARANGEAPTAKDPAAAARTAQRRAGRVDAGLSELDRWLTDQIRQGLAGAARAGYAHWDQMAARLVDAQAPGVAGAVRRLASYAGAPDRLLTELALLRLLISGYARRDDLPDDVLATVRSRIGFPITTEDVLAGEPVRDEWTVLGQRDEVEERLTVRRVWARGTSTGRCALVLSFAAPGQALSADLVVGTTVDADLCFYPGRTPLRAVVANRHAPPTPTDVGPPGEPTIRQALTGLAGALAGEPWLERWPMVLTGVTPATDRGGRWHLRDADGDALALDPAAGVPWRLIAAIGGAPATVAAEWSPAGLLPLTAWTEGRMVRA
jgi:hypothetical protein